MWPEVDRREAPRVDVAVPVDVGGDADAGTSRDLSVDGMRIELARPLEVASEITVAFALPDESTRMSTTAEVRWCKQVGPKSANRWVVGVSFSAMADEHRERIADFVERHIADVSGE